jgi:hypothetical protein
MAVTEQLNKYWHVSMFQKFIQERTAKMLADASGKRCFCNSSARRMRQPSN